MALVSGPTISDAIGDPSNDVARSWSEDLARRRQKLVDELFLRILNRPATSAEVVNSCLREFAEVQADHGPPGRGDGPSAKPRSPCSGPSRRAQTRRRGPRREARARPGHSRSGRRPEAQRGREAARASDQKRPRPWRRISKSMRPPPPAAMDADWEKAQVRRPTAGSRSGPRRPQRPERAPCSLTAQSDGSIVVTGHQPEWRPYEVVRRDRPGRRSPRSAWRSWPTMPSARPWPRSRR